MLLKSNDTESRLIVPLTMLPWGSSVSTTSPDVASRQPIPICPCLPWTWSPVCLIQKVTAALELSTHCSPPPDSPPEYSQWPLRSIGGGGGRLVARPALNPT